MRPSKTYFKNTVPDAVFCASRNTVLDGVLVIGRRLWRDGEHKVRPSKNGVYLEHEFEDVPRRTSFAWVNFKFGLSWGTILVLENRVLENFWLERTI
jgi:hypothetical protein